jgi:hypothetical protein
MTRAIIDGLSYRQKKNVLLDVCWRHLFVLHYSASERLGRSLAVGGPGMEKVASSRRESCTVINNPFWTEALRFGLCYWNEARHDSLMALFEYDVAARVEQFKAQIGCRLLWEDSEWNKYTANE